ncbi:EamA family transporter RarD [Novosphingobium colocasiae]|uniref:EamA family transporter RarD n=1 Tax=Novosphingobium colocasiae TaxID=1256513 RepID=UPI0035AEDF93
MSPPEKPGLGGLPQALGAYFLWTLYPLYFALLRAVSAFEVVAWRMLFTLPFCAVMIALLRQGAELRAVLRNPRMLGALGLSGVLIGTNWLIYVISVTHGHILAASLGYYINPLVSVLAGAVFLHERLSRLRIVALMLAAAGVVLLARDALPTLWISLTLAFSFAAYGLIRKLVPVSALTGLTVETLVLLAPALGMLAWCATSPAGLGMGTSVTVSVALACAGVVTAVPLILFAAAARRLDLSVLGFLQFITPTGLFLMGLALFHETLRPVQLVCFLFIWTAMIVFCWDLYLQRNRAARG